MSAMSVSVSYDVQGQGHKMFPMSVSVPRIQITVCNLDPRVGPPEGPPS